MPKYNHPRKTWQYTKDFKIKAVKLNYQEGIKVQQVAGGLDIHSMMLSCWRREYREGKLQGVTFLKILMGVTSRSNGVIIFCYEKAPCWSS